MRGAPSLAFYCDFDGTIAQQDMIGAIVRHFLPETGQAIVDKVTAGEWSVRQGVEAMFAEIPSHLLPQIQAFARQETRVRPGFAEFVATCRQRGWRLTVVSGGFDFFVHPALKPYQDVVSVYCNRLDDAGPYLRVVWSVPCDEACDGGCGLCKPTVIRRTRRPGERVVVIGDGVTDLKQAQLADFVFARDKLLQACRSLGLRHAAFETFYDIIGHLTTDLVWKE
ncbi:MtnX-like HAD-IB family phosphatase [Alicyclobacillus shizuokensis]|uniref:MtnX-like HAD-IB family phosphatase n=1 Tax=Alicyclobacillus shizuokensis TaxID=392014 RepID=UPI00082991E3|nr:MtnX-like HAD-IB family phosphatase [Alicyclobacillus shizuokensis]MCL6625505.1 MtnX-like HAD-IB family phosphatase [Alicyclobacillus shizuokensis]